MPLSWEDAYNCAASKDKSDVDPALNIAVILEIRSYTQIRLPYKCRARVVSFFLGASNSKVKFYRRMLYKGINQPSWMHMPQGEYGKGEIEEEDKK